MKTETFDLLALLQAFRDEQVYFRADDAEDNVFVAIRTPGADADDLDNQPNLDERREPVLTRAAG